MTCLCKYQLTVATLKLIVSHSCEFLYTFAHFRLSAVVSKLTSSGRSGQVNKSGQWGLPQTAGRGGTRERGPIQSAKECE